MSPRRPPNEPDTGPAAQVVAILRQREQTLGVAESLTGGLLAAAFVDVPGASAVFRGGLVVYATDLKELLAGVPRALLAERGPVDPDVAAALAAGTRQRLHVDWAAATTGVAGPQPHGGAAVGTVWLAVCGPTTQVTRLVRLTGGRQAIRSAAVAAAVGLVAEAVAGGPTATDPR